MCRAILVNLKTNGHIPWRYKFDIKVAPKKIFITIPWFLPAFRAGGPIQSVANLVKEYEDGVS